MAKTDLYSVDPSRLAGLLRISTETGQDWLPDQLERMLQAELTAAVEFDLAALRGGAAHKLATAAAAQGLLVKSIGDLLQHPTPPLELLKMAKQFAKAAREQPDSPLPQEIATVIYFATIAAALIRCGARIADLDDVALREGFAWVCRQAWVDECTRALVDDALRQLPV